MKKTIENIANMYRQDGRAFVNHLVGVGTSIATGAATSGYLEKIVKCTPMINSAITTPVVAVSYWTPLIGLTAYQERKEMKNELGNYDRKNIITKSIEYASFIGIGESLYAGVRGVLHYQIQKRITSDMATASALTDFSCAIAYGLLLPPVKNIIRKVVDKVRKIKKK